MKIAVIGTGRVGSVLGRRWVEVGHSVILGSRRANAPDATTLFDLPVALPVEAAQQADIVVLATPWPATEDAVKSLGDLTGKILIDCTNPLGAGFSFEGTPGNSGAEQVSQWAKGARVVKAFNTTGAKNMGDPVLEGKKLMMFICGDDADAKQDVMQLAKDLDFEAVDSGSLSHAIYLESLAMLWITQAFQNGWGPDFGFAIVRRPA